WATNWLYALASKSCTLDHFHADLPFPFRSNYRLTARIIEESARLLRTKSKASRFYLAFHPTVRTGARLARELAGGEVQVLDFTGLWAAGDARYMIVGDWHPAP